MFFFAYKDDLQQVEKCINDNVISKIKLIPEVAHHLIDSGGKRFRPLLLLICARLCGYHGESRFRWPRSWNSFIRPPFFTMTLLIRLQSGAAKTSANQIYGNAISILVGDFLCLQIIHADDRNRQSRYFKNLFPKWEI